MCKLHVSNPCLADRASCNGCGIARPGRYANTGHWDMGVFFFRDAPHGFRVYWGPPWPHLRAGLCFEVVTRAQQ